MKRAPARTTAPPPMPRFADRLQDGERLLWEGRPDVRVFIRSVRTEIAWLLLPLIPLILLLEYGICWGVMPWSSPVTWACPGILWVIGWFALTITVPAQAQTAAYALTDRRLFIQRLESLTSQDWRPRIDEIPLQSIRPGLRLTGNGFGTIALGASWAAVYNTQRELRAISDAAAVFALLTQAQAAVPEAPQKTAWTQDDALRHGEIILWQGEMDPTTDRREGLWVIPVMALVMAAIGGAILYEIGQWSWLWQGLIFAGSLVIVVPIANSDRKSPAARPSYALTNQRVLILMLSPSGPQIMERELPETRNMRLKRGQNGVGTIIFEKITRLVGQDLETYEFSFQQIADVEAVYGMIQAAQFGYRMQAGARK